MPNDITASAHGAPSLVANAIKRAGARTGVGFDFLMKMATRESSLNPNAKAKTSSAAGLFQFIEQTWLGAVKSHGARHGFADYAADIERSANGKFTVANASRREEILNLRFDADASAALAGELANENKSFLETRLGRTVSGADLYTAHFLGPAGAVKLMSAAATTPAADILPRAAAANKHVFYDGARAKSVGEVMASIAASMGGAAQTAKMPEETIAIASPATRVDTTSPTVVADEQRRAAQPETLAPFQATRIERIETPSFIPVNRLSSLALSVLQALDPTRLSSHRSDDDKSNSI